MNKLELKLELFFCCFLCLLFTASCNGQPQYTKTKLIPIDTLDTRITDCFYDEQTKQNYLIQGHRGEIYFDSITIYNENLAKLYSINLGGDETESTFFTIKSLDSIFSISMKKFRLNHFNRDGLLNSWNILIFNDSISLGFPFSAALVIIENNVYFHVSSIPRPTYANLYDLNDFEKIKDFFLHKS
jgi:hypothetical protein